MISGGAVLLCLVVGAVVCGTVVVAIVKLGEIWGWWGGERDGDHVYVYGYDAEAGVAMPVARREFGSSIFIPIAWQDPIVAAAKWAMSLPRTRRPYDWAHRDGFLNPEGRMITHRGRLLGTTEWPR